MMIAIEFKAISKSFRQGLMASCRALNEVSFEVYEGEAFGFIGQNGAGKSTSIKILTGALRADSGAASLFGVDVADHRSRKGMGYVPESPWLYDYLSPLEILKMGVHAHGLKPASGIKAHCMNWLERFDIAHVANKRIRDFSKGMVQRTALAHALACQPRLLILDEPLSGLDPVGRKDVVDVLLEYRQTGGTIFFSSHVLHDVERLADRFGLIHKGELRTVQAPHELLGSEQRFSVRSVGDAAVDGMQSDVGNRWFAEVTQTQLWELLNRVERAGHQILEVKPSLSLETAFLQYVSAGS